MKKIFIIIFIVFLAAGSTHAASFNPNYIIDDSELEDASALSQKAIQRFLESKGSFLAKFTQVIKGLRKTASQIIFEEAQLYQISPKVILAMLQKEQSLVTDANPSQDQLDWATGFGVCDSCSKSDPALTPLKGFYNQVSDFAEKVRVNYLRDLYKLGRTLTGWGPSITKTTVDGFTITPVNRATSILYTYNPWRGGGASGHGANFNFWKIWQRYFTRTYPDGALLQVAGKAGVWLVQYGKARPFVSKTALISRYDPNRIIQVTQNELDKYETGAPIKFANYSLLRNPRGTVFLLVDDTIRGITSYEVFRAIGFNPEEVIKASFADLKPYKEGEPITLASAYPAGGLLQNKKTGAVYYVKDGQKQAVVDKTVLSVNFKRQRPTPVAPDELDKYEEIAPLPFSDGTLVKSPPQAAVFVIAGGFRRPVASMEAFDKLGYRRQNIVKVPEKALNIHPLGDMLDVVTIDNGEEVVGENVNK